MGFRVAVMVMFSGTIAVNQVLVLWYGKVWVRAVVSGRVTVGVNATQTVTM